MIKRGLLDLQVPTVEDLLRPKTFQRDQYQEATELSKQIKDKALLFIHRILVIKLMRFSHQASLFKNKCQVTLERASTATKKTLKHKSKSMLRQRRSKIIMIILLLSRKLTSITIRNKTLTLTYCHKPSSKRIIISSKWNTKTKMDKSTEMMKRWI